MYHGQRWHCDGVVIDYADTCWNSHWLYRHNFDIVADYVNMVLALLLTVWTQYLQTGSCWLCRHVNDLAFKRRQFLVNEQCFFVPICSFVSFRMLNIPFREIRNMRNFLSHAKASFGKHKISRNKEHFFAKYETRFAWNSREFCTKETRLSTLIVQKKYILLTYKPKNVLLKLTTAKHTWAGSFCSPH